MSDRRTEIDYGTVPWMTDVSNRSFFVSIRGGLAHRMFFTVE